MEGTSVSGSEAAVHGACQEQSAGTSSYMFPYLPKAGGGPGGRALPRSCSLSHTLPRAIS